MRLQPQNVLANSESLDANVEKVRPTSVHMTNGSKVLIYLTLISFFLHYLQESKRQINQNFGTACHTEDCLTFSRLVAKLSEMITSFQGPNLNINST